MKKIVKLLFSILGVVSITALMISPAFAQDTEDPDDVENFQGTAYNEAVRLTWNAVTDNVGVEGYYVHYGLVTVDEPGKSYDNIVDVENVTEYLLTELSNDTEYFFSVVAYDAEANESLRWAEELALTPSESAGDYADDTAPTVSEAEALNKEQVRVVFSEEIVLPDEDPQDAFQIEDDDLLEPLVVLAAEMDDEDESGVSVILTTDEQVEGTTYTLTVTSDIEDVSGNPINSGTSDTAIFAGSGADIDEGDSEGPILIDVEDVDNTHVVVEFDEAVVLSIDPSENFVIVAEDFPTLVLTILGVELIANGDDVEDAAALITTSPQSATSYVVTALDIEDVFGNEISVARSSGLFDGIAAGDDDDDDDVADAQAPADASGLAAEIVEEAGKFLVKLTWMKSADVDDVVQQIVYMSSDSEEYDRDATLSSSAQDHEVSDLEAGEYWFKVTQKDDAGNESEGIIKKVVLAKTGPGIVGLVLVSLGLGRLVNRRKNRK